MQKIIYTKNGNSHEGFTQNPRKLVKILLDGGYTILSQENATEGDLDALQAKISKEPKPKTNNKYDYRDLDGKFKRKTLWI